jgi:hypothetical protein
MLAGNAIGGSAVEIQAAPGVAGALLAFPRGVVRVLFQPFPWRIRSFNTGLGAVENLFILRFIIPPRPTCRRRPRSVGGTSHDNFVRPAPASHSR